MKKIAILYPAHYEQSSGGAEIQILYLINACKQQNWEIHYIFEDKGTDIKNKENIVLHPLCKMKNYKFCGKGWFLYEKQILRELNAIKPDTIYTRIGSSWIGIATSYAKNHKVKHAHALASDSSVTRKLLGKPLYPLFSQIETYYINKGLVGADVIIAQNVFQQQMLSKRYGKESILVNQMTPSVDESCLQKKYNKIKIIWVANFKELKHPELFVQLAKDLKGHSDRIEMYMCGRSTSKYNNLLQDLNHIDYLNYLGSLDQEQVFDLMNEAHILVNTSEYEGFSNTFVQAWMRKVVVVSMNSNPSDILTSQGIGFLTPNMTNLVATIHKLIEHPEIISELGEKSYQYALENHDLNKNMKKIIEVLLHLSKSLPYIHSSSRKSYQLLIILQEQNV